MYLRKLTIWHTFLFIFSFLVLSFPQCVLQGLEEKGKEFVPVCGYIDEIDGWMGWLSFCDGGLHHQLKI